MVNLEDLTKPQLIQIIKTYNKELKIAFTNRTKQELIDIIKSFMNVYEGYIETKPKKIVTEKPKLKKVKDPLKELIGQRGALRGEIEKYKSELEDMNEELKYDLKLKKDKSFVDNYKQKIKDVNKLILMLKEVNKQISKLEVKPKVKEDIIERIKRDEERYKKEDEKHQEMLKLIEKTDKLVKQKPKEQPKKKEDIEKYTVIDNQLKKPEVIQLKFKNLIKFKDVKVDNKSSLSEHIIEANINEIKQHIAHITTFLDKKLLTIRYIRTEDKFRGKGYTEKSFLLLWAYMTYKKYFDNIHIIRLEYASSVPTWTTYNRMINEVGFYNPLLDILNKNIDNDKKYLIHYYLLNNSLFKKGSIGELHFARKDSDEYKKIKNEYENTFKNILDNNLFVNTGSLVNKYKLYGEPYFANKNVDYEKIGKDLQQLFKKEEPKEQPKNLKKELKELLKKAKQQDKKDIKQKKEFEETEKKFKEASKPKPKPKPKAILKELQIYKQSQPQRQQNKGKLEVSVNKSGNRIIINGEEYTKQLAREILAKYVDFPPKIFKKTNKEIVDYFNLNYDDKYIEMSEDQKKVYEFFRTIFLQLEYLDQINEEYEKLEEEDDEIIDVINKLEETLPKELKFNLQDIKKLIIEYDIKSPLIIIILNGLLVDSKSDTSIINDKLIKDIEKITKYNEDILKKFSKTDMLSKLMDGIFIFNELIQDLEDRGDDDYIDEARMFVEQYDNLLQKIKAQKKGGMMTRKLKKYNKK